MKKIYFMLLSLVLLTACNGQKSTRQKADKDEKPVITVSIEPLRYFTEAIVGDRFKVVSMVPKGVSPETYDPTPQQLIDLAHSKAYFRIGYIGFEQTWADKLSDNAPHLSFFNLSKGIDLIYDEAHAHSHDDRPAAPAGTAPKTTDHEAKGVEPHIWNSTVNAQIIAGNIVKAMLMLDEGNDTLYMARYNELARKIEHTDSLICAMLSTPQADRSFMIYHPALSYFARDYDLHQIAIEDGGKEPSPAHLKELIQTTKEENVHVVFVQPEFDRRNAEVIAQQTGSQVVDINPLAYDWEAEMLRVARALVNPPAAATRP